MAHDVYTATIDAAGNASFSRANDSGAAVSSLQTLIAAISYTTFATDLATLVADGASPTQAHVTAVNNAWTTLKAEIDAVVSDNVTGVSGTVDANIVLLVDPAAVVSKNALLIAGRRMLELATNNASGLT